MEVIVCSALRGPQHNKGTLVSCGDGFFLVVAMSSAKGVLLSRWQG